MKSLSSQISKSTFTGPDQRWGLLAVILFAILMTTLIGLLTPALSRFESANADLITRDSELPKNQTAAHYEWKLDEPTLLTRLSAWGFYGLHQILAWGMIYWAAKRKKELPKTNQQKYGSTLDPAGIGFFVVNVIFNLLHLGQTHLFYDGLAQDVAVMSSQGSVIVMLVLILIMQNDRRGLFFGKRIPMPKKAVDFIKKYHGYYVAWALIYTLWFHPMTGTFGHLAGFIYMFLLLGQGTLMFTKIHVSLKWSALLEGLVLVHGTTVALIGQQSPLWTMFFSGFGFVFIASTLWGIKAPKAVNVALGVIYVISVLALYSGFFSASGSLFSQKISQIHQALWIPFTLYALIPVFLLLAAILALIKNHLTETAVKTK